jgi:dihydrofolate reductase
MSTAQSAGSGQRPFTVSAFIATSLDGYIAGPDGDLDWLVSRAKDAGPTGYDEFMAGIDTLVVGRNTYEMAVSFGEQSWPYDGRQVAVLSRRLAVEADPRVTVHRDLDELIPALTESGARHVYADGGQVVQSFLRARLLDELTITTAPVLLGTGIPLFGLTDGQVELTHRTTRVLGAGFVQSVYNLTNAVV